MNVFPTHAMPTAHRYVVTRDGKAYLCKALTCASFGWLGAEPVWSKAPVLRAASVLSASVFTQCPCPFKLFSRCPSCTVALHTDAQRSWGRVLAPASALSANVFTQCSCSFRCSLKVQSCILLLPLDNIVLIHRLRYQGHQGIRPSVRHRHRSYSGKNRRSHVCSKFRTHCTCASQTLMEQSRAAE